MGSRSSTIFRKMSAQFCEGPLLAHSRRQAVAKNRSRGVRCQGYRDHSRPRDARKSHAQRSKRSKTAINPYGARLSCVSHNSLSHEKKSAVTAVHARRKHLPIFPKRSFRAFLRRVGFLKRRLGLGKFALFLKGAAQISMKERLARIECDGLFVNMSPMEGSIARFSATRQSDRVYDGGTASVRRRHDPNMVYPKCKHTYLLKATRWKRRGCPRGKNT